MCPLLNQWKPQHSIGLITSQTFDITVIFVWLQCSALFAFAVFYIAQKATWSNVKSSIMCPPLSPATSTHQHLDIRGPGQLSHRWLYHRPTEATSHIRVVVSTGHPRVLLLRRHGPSYPQGVHEAYQDTRWILRFLLCSAVQVSSENEV